jgi:hypothetical protein
LIALFVPKKKKLRFEIFIARFVSKLKIKNKELQGLYKLYHSQLAEISFSNRNA